MVQKMAGDEEPERRELRVSIGLRQLRAFVAVYRWGRVNEAARQLSVTPSAVSLLVRQLEDELGVPLFDRRSRGLQPTQAADEAIVRAERILADLDAFGRDLRDLRELRRGLVRLAVTPAVGLALLPAACQRFVARHPGVQLEIVDCAPDQFVPRVLAGQVEFGIGTPDFEDSGIQTDVLLRDPLCVVLPADHPLADRRQVRWRQLQGLPVVAGTPGYGVRRLSDAAAARAGIALRVVNEVNFLNSILWMVAAGLGVGIFPGSLIRTSPYPGLVARPLVAPAVQRPISVVTRRGVALSPAASRFVSMLRETLAATV